MLDNDEILSNAVKDGGSYAIIRNRLNSEGLELESSVKELNDKRIEEFGGSVSEIIGKLNIRTESNTIPIDMCQINGHILLGYDVFLGMKTEVSIEDVFALYDIEENDGTFKAKELNLKESFLSDPDFKRSITELFRYYKSAKIIQITKKENNLFLVFKIGSGVADIKAYKFEVLKNGDVKYIDDISKNGASLPKSHNFDWFETNRNNFSEGKHPHINILDKVFVETINGSLTIKIENNTNDGLGIYSEKVEDQNQSLEDSNVFYSEIGNLILLKILPYREDDYRYFVYNCLTEKVVRIDTIGNSCIQLPEGHGITFPNGYYLESGDYKIFDKESDNLSYFQTISSPNGEDFMYIYYDQLTGFYTIYSYNIINKELENPVHAHGYSIHDDGKFLVFRHSENNEATKVHPLRIWQTSFCSDDYFYNSSKDKESTFLSNIGNSELVRGVSDLYTLINYINKDEVTTSLYEGLIKSSQKCLDDYHWLSDDKLGKINKLIEKIIDTSELVIDEFEKVKSIQSKAIKLINESVDNQKNIISESKLVSHNSISETVVVLGKIKSQMGHLISIKNERYIDVNRIEELQKEIEEVKDDVNSSLIVILQKEESFTQYFDRIENLEKTLEKTNKVVEIDPLEEESLKVTEEVDIINNEVNEIEVNDATVTTVILDKVSEIFSKLNQLKSRIKTKKKSFLSSEAKVEFSSQFKLLSQSVSSSLSKSETPEKCDEELARVMGQIESLESKFADFDEYLTEISEKRNSVQDLFESQKLQLINELQKKTANIEKAANMSLKNISKKVEKFDNVDSLNSYFASDSMVLKIHKYIEQIREYKDTVRADDLEGKLKKIKDQSLRSLRDNKDIFEDNGNVVKMGKHRFSVNKGDIDLTTLPIDNELFYHLTGTDFYEKIDDDELNSLKEFWDIDIISESDNIYRSEYLAYTILNDAEKGNNDLTIGLLMEAKKSEDKDNLLKIIQKYSADKYKEGYIKGIHDHDANLILDSLLNVYKDAGLLKYSQKTRAFSIISYFKDNNENSNVLKVIEKYKNAKSLSESLGNYKHQDAMIKEFMLENSLTDSFDLNDVFLYEMSKYYLESLSLGYNETTTSLEIDITSDANSLCTDFKDFISKTSFNLKDDFSIENYLDIRDWIESFVKMKGKDGQEFFIEEAALLFLNTKDARIKFIEKGLKLTSKIKGLLGEHKTIKDESLTISLDDIMSRGKYQYEVVAPNYERYVELRQNLSKSEREALQLDSFKARPLSSFVRNKLITESYLHLIGDNFAKQIGTLGDSKRTDLMGMLLMISPPGYGKTTLIEYVANKMGLVFLKINCPSLNHSVVSLDPDEAPDATSKKELEKLNLAFEMGNNVLLYLDDIQHTSSEFLQKFISLCDGTRKIEGVWKGKPKTYDLKGKKFAVVMAGNPYTETGEKFEIPDMLANRADIYNLGDQLSNQQGIFELSYIENSLTSNSVLSPLANRDLGDLYKMVDMAKGKNIPINELDYAYSSAEVNEIVNVLKKMISIQEVVLKVNQQYIISASAEDKYRDEPPFKLQGSYRNMNKMVEKIVPAMNDEEITNLILDHYKGESQTLTVGAEDNYLKLKTMLGIANKEETLRYKQILNDFKRNKDVGGSDADGTTKIANQIGNLNDLLQSNFSDNNSGNENIEKLIEISMKNISNNEKKDAEVIELLQNLGLILNKRKERKDKS